MRIIAGEFRGRKLLSPKSDTTRPVTDRVKQSVFDILSPFIEGATVYDCFAGTGSMGLECLSRGAAFVTFFEADKSAGELLRKNIAAVGVAGRSKVVSSDLFRHLSGRRPAAKNVGLVFLDPPYRFLNERPKELQRLAEVFATVDLKPGGLVVFRHDASDSLELPALAKPQVRQYGSMTVEFLEPSAASNPTRDGDTPVLQTHSGG